MMMNVLRVDLKTLNMTFPMADYRCFHLQPIHRLEIIQIMLQKKPDAAALPDQPTIYTKKKWAP